MNAGPENDLDEARLHALVDGRLGPAEREQLEALLASDPQAAEKVQAWAGQLELLKRLHGEVLQDPPPAALVDAARQLRREGARLERWQRWGGIAASVVVAFGAGWLAHSQWDGMGGTPSARGRPLADFGRQAVAAHVVFSPEVRHPVEVPAAQQEHLVQWLSKRLGRPLKVPDLTAQGYELVGGRLLPGEQGARAQFMYQNARTERITLYIGALQPANTTPSSGETAFRFTSQGDTLSFYWIDEGFGYALAGRLGRAELLPLAESVYKQL